MLIEPKNLCFQIPFLKGNLLLSVDRDALVRGALKKLKFGDGDGPNLCRVKKK